VEYATREQAQNAVATLSNQNLMGRLIYVREVRYSTSPRADHSVAKDMRRIVRPNLALAHQAVAVEVASLAVPVELLPSLVDLMGATEASTPACLAAAAARSMSPTFVQTQLLPALVRVLHTNPHVSFLTLSVGRT